MVVMVEMVIPVDDGGVTVVIMAVILSHTHSRIKCERARAIFTSIYFTHRVSSYTPLGTPTLAQQLCVVITLTYSWSLEYAVLVLLLLLTLLLARDE